MHIYLLFSICIINTALGIIQILILLKLRKVAAKLDEAHCAMAGFPGLWAKWPQTQKEIKKRLGSKATLGDAVKAGILTYNEVIFIGRSQFL